MDEKEVGLRDASVQDIQLELIRRRSFNSFNGSMIFASLQRHRDLWLAAWMTRLGFMAGEEGLSPKKRSGWRTMFKFTRTMKPVEPWERVELTRKSCRSGGTDSSIE